MTKQTPHMKPLLHKQRTDTDEPPCKLSVTKLLWRVGIKPVLHEQNIALIYDAAPNYTNIFVPHRGSSHYRDQTWFFMH